MQILFRSLPLILPLFAALAADRPEFRPSERLAKLTADATAAAVKRFAKGGLTKDKIALTIIEMSDPAQPAWANYRGDAPTYPASVVKLFYLVATFHQLDAGALTRTPELDRALHDMIVESSNDATQYVIDVLTGTTGGPELSEDALREWMEKRNFANRYFAALGYQNINVNQKTWCDGPYGRERQSVGLHFENRNRLTTNAVARLWYEIATGRAASPAATREMMNLLHRNPSAKSEDDPNDQATAFSSKALPAGSQYYSKAGWTTDARHDSAYIRLPSGVEYILVTFTTDNSKQTDIIPFVSRLVAQEFSKTQSKAGAAPVSSRDRTGPPGLPR